jgi:hypothetical protein
LQDMLDQDALLDKFREASESDPELAEWIWDLRSAAAEEPITAGEAYARVMTFLGDRLVHGCDPWTQVSEALKELMDDAKENLS